LGVIGYGKKTVIGLRDIFNHSITNKSTTFFHNLSSGYLSGFKKIELYGKILSDRINRIYMFLCIGFRKPEQSRSAFSGHKRPGPQDDSVCAFIRLATIYVKKAFPSFVTPAKAGVQ
jgi:hypothetical protein